MSKNEKTTCVYCAKDLGTVQEIHSVEGGLYCSKECAIANQTEIIVQAAYGTAAKWYDDAAEIVMPLDIGIERS